MISTENLFQSIPFRSTVCGRPVFLTAMLQSLCISAMCAGGTPTNNLSTKRHAAATRGEVNAEWTTVSGNKETTKNHPQGNGQTE